MITDSLYNHRGSETRRALVVVLGRGGMMAMVMMRLRLTLPVRTFDLKGVAVAGMPTRSLILALET
jgi:hypothetical protein